MTDRVDRAKERGAMKTWWDDHLHVLSSIESERELFDQIAIAAAEIGFEYCGYSIQMPFPIAQPTVELFSNYSQQWQRRYQERGYSGTDPTVQHLLKTAMPIVWPNQHYNEAAEFWDEARAHGLCFGWAQSSRDRSGAIGMLTLARKAGQITESELYAKAAKMTWLTQYAHAAMAKLLVPKRIPESTVVLTPREKAILRWTAEGRTAHDIGEILYISERTINFHISNVIEKLHACNKTQAAIKAMALGLLI